MGESSLLTSALLLPIDTLGTSAVSIRQYESRDDSKHGLNCDRGMHTDTSRYYGRTIAGSHTFSKTADQYIAHPRGTVLTWENILVDEGGFVIRGVYL